VAGPSPRPLRLRRVASGILPSAIPLLVMLLERPILSPMPAPADHFQFWAAGHLIATGRSPYERASWVEMAAYGPVPEGAAVNTVLGGPQVTGTFWLYPPQTAFLFAPFGALPIPLGVQLLNLFVLAAAVLALVMAARCVGLSGSRLAFALTLAVTSAPFVVTVRDGHPTGVVLAG